MRQARCELGIVGLGTMGRNLALNFADHGFPVAGHDRDPAGGAALLAAAASLPISVASDLRELAALLSPPRAVLIMVPAGDAVDTVLDGLLPVLSRGDVVADGGNSHFRDTERRAARLAAAGIAYLGVGVSGGEAGARHGPSYMPGGPAEAWQRFRQLLERTAAVAGGEPCVAHLGPGASGHFVKMVHNGIEYALMQLIAESYDLLHRGAGLDDAAVGEIFSRWNGGRLEGYLIEITARILARLDDRTGGPLLERIADAAGQKGTGAWTAHEARDLQVPVPTIDAAVTMRDLSGDITVREALASSLGEPAPHLSHPADQVARLLEDGLAAAMLTSFAQGFALLRRASDAHIWGLDLATIAHVWRGGCIIRAAALGPIQTAYRVQPDLPHLLADRALAHDLMSSRAQLQAVALLGIAAGIPLPAFCACLGYLDAYRAGRLPTSLVQAQRDYFGAHTYRRDDDPEVHHTAWEATS
jgi:6-phosphogluconate dehydrogenase